jgi:site-specific DNA-cytosine methylase
MNDDWDDDSLTRGLPKKYRRLAASCEGAREIQPHPSAPHPICTGLVSNRLQAPRPIRVGSDCTGLNSGVIALELHGLPLEEVFASDINLKVQAMLAHNFPSLQRLYGNIVARNNARIPGKLDLYESAPPCQPFSTMGVNGGVDDGCAVHHRTFVLFKVLDYIVQKKPRTFVLEAVACGGVFGHIMKTLEDIRDASGNRHYHVMHKVVNTANFGLPQNRPRLYIVGLTAAEQLHPFEWPPDKEAPHLKTFLDGLDGPPLVVAGPPLVVAGLVAVQPPPTWQKD